jgi:hypothetical protein
MWNSKDWSYTFTQEWPGSRNWWHQFSYAVAGLHAGSFAGSGGGLGDTILNWNIGGTFIPHAQSADHLQTSSMGYNPGQSFIAIVHPRLNIMLETCTGAFQSVVGRGTTAWSQTLCTSPGVRWAFNMKKGLQIVPGVAVPAGIGPSAGERGLFLYLSFEHPFRRISGPAPCSPYTRAMQDAGDDGYLCHNSCQYSTVVSLLTLRAKTSLDPALTPAAPAGSPPLPPPRPGPPPPGTASGDRSVVLRKGSSTAGAWPPE